MNEVSEKIRNFTDMYAWKDGHRLVLMIYECTRKFPREEIYGLVSQMRRAAVSVTSNLAEGFGHRTMPDKAQFYTITAGSLSELHNQLIIVRDLALISDVDFNTIQEQLIRTHKLVNGLISSTRTPRF